MPAPPKLFLTLLYKLEGPHTEFTVALELTTWDSGTCHEGNVTSLPGEDPTPSHALCSKHPLHGGGMGAWDQLSPSPPWSCSLRQSPAAVITPGSSRRHHPASPSCLPPATVAPMAGPAGECAAGTLCPWAGIGTPGLPWHCACSAPLLPGAMRWIFRTATSETSPCSCPASSPARRRCPSPASSGRSG